ncbi:hypothetical protein CPB84DRAFT_1749595 [Gymnopilus junonius]|uniref:Uncharacterized protein n=1 Tax=Gymnopilus junonius TaxID=109634 RepID=A0A9P5TJD2_GYMJU|nr:hypothetical protein CPB84DRAFT_1749595 [Gymnopilus junonius]
MYSTIVSIVSLFIACHLAIAAPVPDTTNQVDNAYSGVGGHAIGGSVTHNTISGTRLLGGSLGLLKLFSDNAGSGGRANSAPAVATIPSNLRVGTSSSNTDSSTSNIVGNSFSGAGGITDGGSVNGAGDALISLFSGRTAAMM